MLTVRGRNLSVHGSNVYGGTKKGSIDRDHVWNRDQDLVGKIKAQEAERTNWSGTIYLAYGSLGVIYGDIGTSIIFVFSQVFQSTDLRDSPDLRVDIYGAVSLVFWTLTVIALFKYVLIVLRANDTGEGGTVALYAQLCRTMGISPFGTMRMEDHKQVLALRSAGGKLAARPTLGEHRHKAPAAKAPLGSAADKGKPLRKPYIRSYEPRFGFARVEPWYMTHQFRRSKLLQRALLVFTMLATGLVIGDGILMPAFSVNAAISGIDEHGGGISQPAVIGISASVIVVLFFTQHFGTQKLAWAFSPIIILWLLANLGIAIYNLSHYGGDVFNALSPAWIYYFFEKYREHGWQMLSGVMLCVAGTETMFAAMGHFSQPAVAVAFGLFAYPCIVMSYLGQGAYLMEHPQDAQNAYFAHIPDPIFWPMLVLATLSAIVASQAVITGTFSIIRQATSLGVFPKLKIVHTDSFVEGQIFIPFVNYTLMVLCIAVVAGFEGNAIKLGDAYGVAVMAVMIVTTVMVTLIMIVKWSISLCFIIPFLLFFLFIEGVFLSSTLYKVPNGGWFPLAVAAVVVIIMLVWWAGSYARRRLMVRTSKELVACNFIKQFTGGGPSAFPFTGSSSFHNGVESAQGSAIDLGNTLPMYSSGYGAFGGMADDEDIIVIGDGTKDLDSAQPQPHLKRGSGLQKRGPQEFLKRFSLAASLKSPKGSRPTSAKSSPPKSPPQSGRQSDVAGPPPARILGLGRTSSNPAVTLANAAAAAPKSGGGLRKPPALMRNSQAGPARTSRPLAEGTEIEEIAIQGMAEAVSASREALIAATAAATAYAQSGPSYGAGTRGVGARARGGPVAEGTEEDQAAAAASSAGVSDGGGEPELPPPPPPAAAAAAPEAAAATQPTAQPAAQSQLPLPSIPQARTASPSRVSMQADGASSEAKMSPLGRAVVEREAAIAQSPSPHHSPRPRRTSRHAAQVAARRRSLSSAGSVPASPKHRGVKFAEPSSASDDEGGGDAGRDLSSSSPSRRLTRSKSSLALVSRPDKMLSHLSGLGIFYSESPTGIPPVMVHFLRNIDAMHEVVIILTVRFLPMPAISPVERLLVRTVDGVPNFYQVVARYGYQDEVDHGPHFISNLISTILHKLELKAGLKYQGLENDYIGEMEGGVVEDDEEQEPDMDEEAGHNASAQAAALMAAAQSDMYPPSSHDAQSHANFSATSREHRGPYVSRFAVNALERIRIAATAPDAPRVAYEALSMAEALLDTVSEKVVYYQGRTSTRSRKDDGVLHDFVIGTLYRGLEMIAYEDAEAWSIPLHQMVELGMVLEI